mgnify:CR=1 FL=1
MKKETTDLLREAIRAVMLSNILEARKGKKPGGGLTDMGALRRVSPQRYMTQYRGALEASSGDIEQTADRLDVSPRTVYAALEDEPSLQKAKDSAESRGEEGEEKKDREEEEDEDRDSRK